ncbi:anticodon binding domain protein [Dictyocaulus viviparus]|uniref:threonine--tRNA ligase n=1 Tax=Dictyocaulus viviparus TaxID=29172 RepID=A0A0D8YEI5_DICVI|nr:anticodon binding domain protein [Dictyocaulus viviparus]
MVPAQGDDDPDVAYQTTMQWTTNSEGYGQTYTHCDQIIECNQEQRATTGRYECPIQSRLPFFNSLTPKFTYWCPKSTHAYNLLVELITSEYLKRGFHEAVTPNMYADSMWEPSGRCQYFSQEISRLEVLRYEMMTANCSGHCLFYGHRTPSYAELPIKYADFGAIHRSTELCYPLVLPYIYRFIEDDSHIFCRPDQITQEVKESLDLASLFYEQVMKFKIELKLSTRSADIEKWNDAEEALKIILKERSMLRVNDGAAPHYGPRIDIVVREPHGRYYLHGWLQLDFELPERFDLGYENEDGIRLRPVLLHRAVLAPAEIFLGIIGNECARLWPFWLSLQQVAVIPVCASSISYARKVVKELQDANFKVEANYKCTGTLNRRIKLAVSYKHTFTLVVGRNEAVNGTVNIRTRNDHVLGEFPFDEVLSEFRRFVNEYCDDLQCFQTFEKKSSFQNTLSS